MSRIDFWQIGSSSFHKRAHPASRVETEMQRLDMKVGSDQGDSAHRLVC